MLSESKIGEKFMQISSLIPPSTWGKIALGSGPTALVSLIGANYFQASQDHINVCKNKKCNLCWYHKCVGIPFVLLFLAAAVTFTGSSVWGIGKHTYYWLKPSKG